jgi:hypothetical protein
VASIAGTDSVSRPADRQIVNDRNGRRLTFN